MKARHYTLVCRGSKLSLAQAEIFEQKVWRTHPHISIKRLIRKTAGDLNQTTPLHLVEGQNFFTREIQDALYDGVADFAVHSMKDVSTEDFFERSFFAVIDRDFLQDIVVFNEDVITKLRSGAPIIIGTSSPRRNRLVMEFLKKSLPMLSNHPPALKAEPIRGNVDSRLKKLDTGSYDGIVLAVAGLNRLLQRVPSIKTLLNRKKLMVMPLFECPPAPGQGALVVETRKDHEGATSLLHQIEDNTLTRAVALERDLAFPYGYGCSQEFGAFHLDLPGVSFTYLRGYTEHNEPIQDYDLNPPIDPKGKSLFAATDYTGSFYTFQKATATMDSRRKAVFVGSSNAVHTDELVEKIQRKRVWAAGTKTWLSLARLGIWVEGCADGLGLEFIAPLMQSDLIGIAQKEMEILTSKEGASIWSIKGWPTVSTYEATPVHTPIIEREIHKADIIFWSSALQYKMYKHVLKTGVIHCSPFGQTTAQLQSEGLRPVVFPGIKSFQSWRKKNFI